MSFSKGICIARSLKIPRDITAETFDDILEELEYNSKAKVVVMFVNEDNCRSLLAAALRNNVTDFYWLASDSWGKKVHPVKEQETAAEGAVTILPKRKVIKGRHTL